MCNQCSSSVKTLIPKELCNLWPILSRFYSMKVKAHKIAISKCGSLKEG